MGVAVGAGVGVDVGVCVAVGTGVAVAVAVFVGVAVNVAAAAALTVADGRTAGAVLDISGAAQATKAAPRTDTISRIETLPSVRGILEVLTRKASPRCPRWN